MKATLRFEEMPKDYADLCRKFLPRPIRDGVDYANVAEVFAGWPPTSRSAPELFI